MTWPEWFSIDTYCTVQLLHTCNTQGKKPENLDPLDDQNEVQEVSLGDLLVAQLVPSFDAQAEANLESGLANPTAATDEVEDEWNAAIQQRYGKSECHGSTSKSKTSKSARGGAASSSKPGPEPVSSAAAAARSEEEPVHMFIDPSNKRVLADLASGKRIAVGNLEARETWQDQ